MFSLANIAAIMLTTLSVVLAQQTSFQAEQKNGAVPKKEKGESEGAIFGALLFATKEAADQLKDFPKLEQSDAKLAASLAKVFPDYKCFQVLGSESEPLFKAYASWVVPSKEFFLKFDSKGRDEKGGVIIDLQLWHDEKAIVKTDAILKPGSPLLIEGPMWGKGRLIFLVQLQERKSEHR